MKTTTDKATPRPWRLKIPKDGISYWDSSVHTHGRAKVFGRPHPIDGGDYAPLCELFNSADAALIVKAVNEYDALCAVAEAAENLTQSIRLGIKGEREKTIIMMKEPVEKALDALAQIRNPQSAICNQRQGDS